MKLSKERQILLDGLIHDLKEVEGIAALVLGGSYATGQATETSDLDLGLYYYSDEPFDIGKISAVAQKYAIHQEPTVTGFYQWGPWVNGGAWVNTAFGKVDFLYRNIEQVTATIRNCINGEWENHFEQQPPYGFSSVIYLAETKYCIPLYDRDHILGELKKEVAIYPPKLKKRIIQDALWSAEFTLMQIGGFAEKKDLYNTTGCLTRAVKNIVNALFAINERYPIGDKRAIEILEKTDKHPAHLKEQIEHVLVVNKEDPMQNVADLKSLFEQTVCLTDGMYQNTI